MFLGVHDLLFPVHVPFSDGSDDFQSRVHRPDADVDADLIVALSGATVGDGECFFLLCYFDEFLTDERSAQGCAEWVLALVHGVGFYRGKDVVRDELFLGVIGNVPLCPKKVGPPRYLLEVVLLAKIQGDRNDFGVVLFFEPLDADRGVEPSRVREDDNVVQL